MEIWRDIPGYEGIYQVSNLGRIKSLPRIIICSNGYKKNYGSKILKFSSDKNGYSKVALCKFCKQRSFLVHRLVAELFVPNPNNYSEVNHKDENKSNNCSNNLEWCTRKYNVNYGNRTKKQVSHTDYKKIALKIDYKALSKLQKAATQKTVYQYDKNLNLIRKYISLSETEKYGFTPQLISSCCLGKRKTHKGYIWSYTKLD